jgi:hypothetical protein
MYNFPSGLSSTIFVSKPSLQSNIHEVGNELKSSATLPNLLGVVCAIASMARNEAVQSYDLRGSRSVVSGIDPGCFLSLPIAPARHCHNLQKLFALKF